MKLLPRSRTRQTYTPAIQTSDFESLLWRYITHAPEFKIEGSAGDSLSGLRSKSTSTQAHAEIQNCGAGLFIVASPPV